jgi:hypothetical protein
MRNENLFILYYIKTVPPIGIMLRPYQLKSSHLMWNFSYDSGLVHCPGSYVYLLPAAPAAPLLILPVRRAAHGAVTVSSYGCSLYRNRPMCTVLCWCACPLTSFQKSPQMFTAPPVSMPGTIKNVSRSIRTRTSACSMFPAFDRLSRTFRIFDYRIWTEGFERLSRIFTNTRWTSCASEAKDT